MTKTLPKKTSKKPVRKTKELVTEVAPSTQLQVAHHFPCPIYLIERPDFLEAVNTVSEESLEVSRKERDLNEIYPVYMTNSFYGDPRMAGFSEFVGATAWNILNEQGYDMQNMAVSFTEMWTQEHGFNSAMDIHVHGGGSQISAFYFLEVPENVCKIMVHDPRPGKVIINLPEKDASNATLASQGIVFTPEAGTLFFADCLTLGFLIN